MSSQNIEDELTTVVYAERSPMVIFMKCMPIDMRDAEVKELEISKTCVIKIEEELRTVHYDDVYDMFAT